MADIAGGRTNPRGQDSDLPHQGHASQHRPHEETHNERARGPPGRQLS